VAARSAGLLVYDVAEGETVVLLVHPGGPFWANTDDGAWSIPKGEHDPAEDPLAAAYREFAEELGVAAPEGEPHPLGEVTQSGGKRVAAWAVGGHVDVEAIASNTFEMEWPPRSGQRRQFPEVDRAAWFTLAQARVKLLAAQVALLDRLGA